MKSVASPPSTEKDEGRFTVGSCTALVREEDLLNFSHIVELCNTNKLNFTGVALTVINSLNFETEVRAVENV